MVGKKRKKKTKNADEAIDVTPKTEKKRDPKYKVIQSTQQNVPIKYISGDIITTKDGRNLKIIEVKAIPFALKSARDRNSIFRTFKTMFRTGPVRIQIKCMSLKGNLYEQITMLREQKKTEKNKTLGIFYDDYEARLRNSQMNSISRRFFIIFEYIPRSRKKNRKTTQDDINRSLNTSASRLINMLESCGNEVRILDTDDVAEVFYILYNRNKYLTVPFEDKYNYVWARYHASVRDNKKDWYIPFEEFIAPDKVDYTDDDYIIVNDDTYYRFMIIPSDGYTSPMWPGWTEHLLSFSDGIDVDFFFEREESSFVTTKLERNIAQAGAVINESKSTSESTFFANKSREASDYLLNGIRSGENMLYANTLITVTGTSPEEVQYYCDEIKKRMDEMDIKVIELETQYEEAFLSALPICQLDRNIFEKSKRNMLEAGAATFYPFTTFELNDARGIDLGRNLANDSEVILNIFDTKNFANANAFICGMSGSGKTFSFSLMAIRCRLSGIPVMIISPEKDHEFIRLCNAIDGTFVKIAKGSESRINPLEIFERDKTAVDSDNLIDGAYAAKRSLLASKIDFLISLFELVVGEKFSDYNEKVALENLLMATYRRFGITTDNETLWADHSKTAFKQMPTFSDVRETMNSFETVSPKIKNIIQQFTEGMMSNFDGQTNVDMKNKFIVFGVENKDDETMVPISIFIAMDFIWSRFQEDRTKNKILLIDEWWKMAYNPIGADYSMKLARLVRGYGGAVWFATQQMDDIVASGNKGSSVIGNCQIKIMMRMTQENLDAVSKLVNLTAAETDKISKFDKGNALLVAGTNRLTIKFEASKREELYCGTDARTLSEYQLQQQEEKMREEEENRRLASLENFDDVFGQNTTPETPDSNVIDLDSNGNIIQSFDDLEDFDDDLDDFDDFDDGEYQSTAPQTPDNFDDLDSLDDLDDTAWDEADDTAYSDLDELDSLDDDYTVMEDII